MSKQQTKKSLKKFDDPIEYTDKTWHEAEKILHIALRKKALAYKFEYPNSHTEKCIIYLKKDGKVTSYMEHTAYGSWDNCTEKTPWTDQLADEIKDGYILDANVMDIQICKLGLFFLVLCVIFFCLMPCLVCVLYRIVKFLK